MKIHGIRAELQPEAVLKKTREAEKANTQADNPVRGHDNVVPPVKKESINPNRLLDIKG